MRLISSKEESSINERISLLTEEATAAHNGLEVFQERNTALELALEDRDWQKLSDQNNKEFSIEGLKRINELARLYWLKNPTNQKGRVNPNSICICPGRKHPIR